MEVKNLPEKYRDFLKRPFGELIPSSKPSLQEINSIIKDSSYLITVGDASSENISQLGIKSNIQIIDLMERRNKRKFPNLTWDEKRSITNPPGTLSTESIILLRDLIKQNIDSLIVVDGEEDLLALPSILFSPIHAHVLYGQPNEGLVIVSVTESLKVKVYGILIEMGFDENILKY